MQGIRDPDLASAHPRGLLQSFYILGNPEAQKSPSLITDLAGEQLEALTSLCLDHFSLFPHASFSFFAHSWQPHKRHNISERYLQSQAFK